MSVERLRRAVRSVLGPNSRAYRAAAQSASWFATVRSEGLATWRTLQRIRAGRAGAPPERVALRGLMHPMWLRPGTDDVDTVINNVMRAEWGQFAPQREPHWMIDGGAYIGDTAAYFLSRFPQLKVIALEPNRENFALAERNLAPYGERVVLLPLGLYGTEETLRFSGAGIGASIRADGSEEIHCTGVASLLQRFGIDALDVLKMDIEGAEASVFATAPEAWLARTEWILIEMHSAAIEAQLRAVLGRNGFALRRFRSVWYCRRGGVPG